MKTKIVFLHGLEGQANGSKARYLKENYDVIAPALDTSKARAFIEAVSPGTELPEGAYKVPLLQALEAISEHEPDLIIGSSFGGGLASLLAKSGAWDGPTVLLAPAAAKFGVKSLASVLGKVAIIHGTEDTVVDIDQSYALARSEPSLMIYTVDDDHRLARSVLEDGVLDHAIEYVLTE